MIQNPKHLLEQHGSPLFVYSETKLLAKAKELIGAQQPFGHTVRFAAKANPHPDVIKIFMDAGLHFDASSTYEAKLLLDQGVPGRLISLSSQTLDGPLETALDAGVLPVATSLNQIDILANHGVRELAIRVNPGFGSGGNKRTTVGGPASSFGIWFEYMDQVASKISEHSLVINRLHTHTGSGVDPAAWREVMRRSLEITDKLPDVTTLDVGGGYKVARMDSDAGTDMKQVFEVFSDELKSFAEKTGREIHLEIEPGTYLVANAGVLLAEVQDIVDTGKDGYRFLRLNTGMNDILRPSLYGAQHPIEVLNNAIEMREYVVVGHNCESGDILTPAPGDPEGILPRKLKKAAIGDIVAIGGAGAYCASMSASGYNAFPNAAEIVVY